MRRGWCKKGRGVCAFTLCWEISFGSTISYFSSLLEGSLFYFCKKMKCHQTAKMRETGREGGLRLMKLGSNVNARGILNLSLDFISIFWSVSTHSPPLHPQK